MNVEPRVWVSARVRVRVWGMGRRREVGLEMRFGGRRRGIVRPVIILEVIPHLLDDRRQRG